MDDLLKEAIADAKAVRETALENAKIALEEAFTPRLQSMLSKKIQSEIDVEEQEDEEWEDEEAPEEEAPEEGHYAEDDEDPGDEWSAEEEAPEEDEEEMDMEGVIEIDGVKYAPVVSEEDEEEAPEAEEDEMEESDYLDLEAVLRELEEEEGDEEDEMEESKEEVDEKAKPVEEDTDKSSGIGKSDNHDGESDESSKEGAQGPEGEGSDKAAGHENSEDKVVKEQAEDDEEEVDEDIDLEEVIKALSEEEDEEASKNEVSKIQSELDEHRNVVKYLRSKLNEVNLLNAKLLFTNKLFRSYGLTNDQKMKVVENFDRAHNLREVKLVYSTLAESFGSKQTKSEIKESKGSASKPVASTKSEKQEVIAEGHEMRERFKKLAGIL